MMGGRTARDLHLEPVGSVRLRSRLGALTVEESVGRYVAALAAFRRRTGELPSAVEELHAELRVAAGPLPKGCKPLPPLPTHGPTSPESAWNLFQEARGPEVTADVIWARISLVLGGFLPPEAAYAPGGFTPILEPALHLGEDPGRDAEVVR